MAQNDEPVRRRAILVPGPKDFFIAPIFPARPQTTQRVIEVDPWVYTIGGFHPYPVPAGRIPPALWVRHARTLFTALSFLPKDALTKLLPDQGPIPAEERFVSYSMNEFCHRFASSNGGSYSRNIAILLGDLADTWIRMANSKTKETIEFRMLENPEIYRRGITRRDALAVNSNQLEFRYNQAVISEKFFRLLRRSPEVLYLRLDVLTSITSPLGQSIYLYVPSRAFHKTEQTAWVIGLSTLLEQVKYPVPTHKSERLRIFTSTRNKTKSLLEQLDNAETMTGRFRVRLIDGKNDAQLSCWMERSRNGPEPQQEPREDSKVYQAWISSGGSHVEFIRRLKAKHSLDVYELELLGKAIPNYRSSEAFYALAKALIKESEFRMLAHEIHGEVTERTVSIVDAGSIFGSRLMECIRRAAAKSSGK